jgi:NADH dehydrogenase
VPDAPLLYQVATAALSPADIAAATRSMFGRDTNVSVLLNDVIGVDAKAKRVELRQGGSMAYDALVLATGADYSFFGYDAWAAHAPVLKTLDEANADKHGIVTAPTRIATHVPWFPVTAITTAPADP